MERLGRLLVSIVGGFVSHHLRIGIFWKSARGDFLVVLLIQLCSISSSMILKRKGRARKWDFSYIIESILELWHN